MRAVWFIGKLELVLNCNNYENLNPKSRTSQTRKTLCVMLLNRNILTKTEFLEAYKNGQRHFCDIDLDDAGSINNIDLSDIIFERCSINTDFRSCNLTNSKFISCNTKEIDLRYTKLTNALMTNCLVESAMFKGATVDGFKFIDNYYFGSTIGQEHFANDIVNGDAYILKMEISKEQYLNTMGGKMTDVTETAEAVVDIWDYVEKLTYENIVSRFVLENNLIEKVYRNNSKSFEHVLLQTDKDEVFVIIIIDLKNKTILGHYRLDLSREYDIT